jgi:hypothetical protein
VAMIETAAAVTTETTVEGMVIMVVDGTDS